MNLLTFCYEHPPIGGGAGNALAHLAREWAGNGHRVTLVTSGYRELPREEEFEGVKILRLNVGRRSPTRGRVIEMARFMLACRLSAEKIYRQTRPDLSVVFMPIPSGLGALHLRRKYGLPMISELRGGDVPGFDPARLKRLHGLTALLVKRLWDGSVRRIANSEGLAALATRFSPASSVLVLPNGVDIQKFCPSGPKSAPAKGLSLVFVGRFAETQKNITTLLRALTLVPGVSLTLVGDGPDRARLERLSGDLGLEARVKWVGWLKDEELIRTLRSADAYVSASRWEGMSNAALEAMSCGLPLLLSRAAGHTELVRPDLNGRLFDPDDPEALAGICREWIARPERLIVMGQESRKFAVADHPWELIARQRMTLYQKAIGV